MAEWHGLGPELSRCWSEGDLWFRKGGICEGPPLPDEWGRCAE